jgi:hypothetical protein
MHGLNQNSPTSLAKTPSGAVICTPPKDTWILEGDNVAGRRLVTRISLPGRTTTVRSQFTTGRRGNTERQQKASGDGLFVFPMASKSKPAAVQREWIVTIRTSGYT